MPQMAPSLWVIVSSSVFMVFFMFLCVNHYSCVNTSSHLPSSPCQNNSTTMKLSNMLLK